MARGAHSGRGDNRSAKRSPRFARAALAARYAPPAMDEFIKLLLDATQRLGSVSAVADAIDAEPAPIYAWIAGNDLPKGERLRLLTRRLNEVLEGAG